MYATDGYSSVSCGYSSVSGVQIYSMTNFYFIFAPKEAFVIALDLIFRIVALGVDYFLEVEDYLTKSISKLWQTEFYLYFYIDLKLNYAVAALQTQ